jgi:hypothetical protein
MVNVNGQTIEAAGVLPFVNIYEVGTNNSTQSDENGNFTITVASINAALQFSFVGYATTTLSVKEVMDLSYVELAADSELLNEVIIPPKPKPPTSSNNLLWWIVGSVVVVGIGYQLTKPKQQVKPKLSKPKTQTVKPKRKRTNPKTKKVIKVSL